MRIYYTDIIVAVMVAMMTVPALGYISVQPLYDMYSEPSPLPEDMAQTSNNSRPLEKIFIFVELVCKVTHLGGIRN